MRIQETIRKRYNTTDNSSIHSMSGLLSKAVQIYHEDGLIPLTRRAVRFSHNRFVRPNLPEKIVSYNGVSVRGSRLGDGIVPWQSTDIPGYEGELVRGINQYVSPGDTVVIVGGGWGVSSVAAAKQSGESGKVITFEGSKDAVENVEDTIRLNGFTDQISVRHAIVAQAISLRGSEGEAETVAPRDLPECDVLVLDCEGAEVDILTQMEIRPDTVIVETHGMLGAPEDEVEDRLREDGYQPVTNEVAEERLRDTCEAKGIYVICAEYNAQSEIRDR